MTPFIRQPLGIKGCNIPSRITPKRSIGAKIYFKLNSVERELWNLKTHTRFYGKTEGNQ